MRERARFHKVGNGIAVGLIRRRGSCHPIHFFSPSLVRPHENAVTTYSGSGAKSRGDADSHGPSVSLCTQPLSILFDLTPRTSHVNPSTRIRPFSSSVSNDLHKLSFHVFARVSLTASRENESTDFQ